VVNTALEAVKGQKAGDGEARRASNASGTAALRLLTLNVGLLAFRIWGRRGLSFAPHIDERLASTPDHLNAIEADIIALQEIYDGAHSRFIRDALFRTHPYAFFPRSLRSVLGSGLMVLSRHPIVQAEFLRGRGGPVIANTISEKGALCVMVDIAGYGPLRLINVHLSVGGAFRRPQIKESRTHRATEIDQVLALSRPSPGRPPAILVGDFNCSPLVSPEIYDRIIAAGFIDAFAAVTPADIARNAVTWDRANPANANGRYRHAPSQRIDHVFIPAALRDHTIPVSSAIEFQNPTVPVAAARTVTLSDHYGLSVRLALKT
jgi:endonuclease/exonuclease/phosphatase family metal-dependent hydrolase